MSSGISTDVRSSAGSGRPESVDGRLKSKQAGDDSLQPWHLFALAAIGCATAVTFIARGQGPVKIVLLGILMATAAYVGVAALRVLRPLVGPDEDRTVMIGERTRVALEREKMLVLRSIKELEFDRAMGKVSDADWHEMSGRLRARAGRLMRQLDAGASYRDQIEKVLASRLGAIADQKSANQVAVVCAGCSTSNDGDAKFCKNCGQRL